MCLIIKEKKFKIFFWGSGKMGFEGGTFWDFWDCWDFGGLLGLWDFWDFGDFWDCWALGIWGYRKSTQFFRLRGDNKLNAII
jgi:hypothetical protein